MKENIKKKRAKKKFGFWKIVLCLVLAAAVIIPGYMFVSGYLKSLPAITYNLYVGEAEAASYPDVRFAVISDLHFYDVSLGTTGAAFEAELLGDRKLLVESEELLNFAIGQLLRSDVQFVLISGDLTKDGETLNHEGLAKKLQLLVDNGIKVYVAPGNHDVNSFDAVRFEGGQRIPVDAVSVEDFARIYANMGYGQAIKRDPGSLSYVAEPTPGLWVLSIDACRYPENEPGEPQLVAGRVSQELESWLADVLSEAAEQGKAVLALMHHGVVEHWDGQARLHPDYLVEDFKHFGEFLASYNVRLVFTGHYHAQNIAQANFGSKTLYDVETGSLVTYPCPIRYCEIKDGTFTVVTDTIADKLRPGTDFAETAQAFVKQTVMLEAKNTLLKYRVSEQDADIIADAVGDAFAAHYSGDADPALRTHVETGRLSLWGRIVYSTQRYVLDGLWAASPLPDNNASFRLD
ncbi:MAG: metallophosphoesterase [Clostridia bacterium]|nr:metallophosphoesterase [Clostridia bacterium]